MVFYKLGVFLQPPQMVYAALFNLLSAKNSGPLSIVSFPKRGFLETTTLEN